MTPVNPEILIALNAGISSEIASYVFYVAACKKLNDQHLIDILKKLALEEKDHYHILERQHHALVTSEKWISTSDILKEPGLPEIGEDMAEKHRALINEVKNATDTLTVLKIAYRLEVEAYELFHGQIDKTNSAEAKKMYDTLAKFEQGHMKTIQGMIDAL
jgi:rubrerythrin